MWQLTGETKYRDAFDIFADRILHVTSRTPKGLVYIDSWATNRHAANVAHVFFQVRVGV